MRGEVSLRKAEDIVTNFVVTCNGEAYITADKSVAYGEGLIAAVTFILEVRGATS